MLSQFGNWTISYNKEQKMARAARPVASLIFQTRCADHARSSGLHRDMREMIRWAEGKFSDMTAAEHHLSGDGFLSSPLDYAAMILGATETMKVSGCAVLAPLYNPLNLAERITFLDLISNGRFRTVLALGYREQEYRAAGVDWQQRGKHWRYHSCQFRTQIYNARYRNPGQRP